ncbi:SpaA isopeptide-forming pilin-related protein [Lacticaseibacillus suibinensis]|uniref:SpaA isopeptide-forming pilin-related protein n=1 Tax=Lacticaseibacillus suibinensis TaxID=2486011 RepID=UPI000F7BA6D2|nr:pilin N-terminal domain-containing protein [Lacticaseibacillus suibinensis]
MKKSFLKKALVMAGAALLALPLVLGNGNLVSAADGDGATPTTDPVAKQSITLVKYAYTNKADFPTENTSDDIFTKSTDTTTKRLSNVTFNVYNVSQQYWDNPDHYQDKDGQIVANGELKEAGTPVAMKTDANGEATASFDVFTKVTIKDKEVQRPSVYVFKEDPLTTQGYDKQNDFALSLPQGGLTDGKYQDLYVYPKNKSTSTFDLKFKKIDSITKDALAGAKFNIMKGNLYATILKDGTRVATVDQYDEKNPVDVKWTSDKSEATEFISDKDGYVGFVAVIENTQNGVLHGIAENGKYTAWEVDAPAGYEVPAKKDTPITEKDNSVEIPNTPKGLLPHTGGAGIVLFVVLGAALVVLGGVAYNKRRTSF